MKTCVDCSSRLKVVDVSCQFWKYVIMCHNCGRIYDRSNSAEILQNWIDREDWSIFDRETHIPGKAHV
jgi:hypothetical protein